jgi:hypothetical protein
VSCPNHEIRSLFDDATGFRRPDVPVRPARAPFLPAQPPPPPDTNRTQEWCTSRGPLGPLVCEGFSLLGGVLRWQWALEGLPGAGQGPDASLCRVSAEWRMAASIPRRRARRRLTRSRATLHLRAGVDTYMSHPTSLQTQVSSLDASHPIPSHPIPSHPIPSSSLCLRGL